MSHNMFLFICFMFFLQLLHKLRRQEANAAPAAGRGKVLQLRGATQLLFPRPPRGRQFP